MAWTKDQEEAIYTQINDARGTIEGRQDGKNVIVSAGAGSGKTAVLTERIIEILKSGATLDQLLVLTFTNAAASEMKERVRKKINQSTDERVKSMSSLVDNANITTFDAYSLGIVKKYGYILGVDKDITIMDSFYSDLKTKEILNDILSEYYKEPDERLLHIFDLYPQKNDDALIGSILSMYDAVSLKQDTIGFLENYDSSFYSDENIESIKERLTRQLFKEVLSLKKYFEKLKEETENVRDYIIDSGLNQEWIDESILEFTDDYFELIAGGPNLSALDAFFNQKYQSIPQFNKKGAKNEELKERRSSMKPPMERIKYELDKDKKLKKSLLLCKEGVIEERIENDRILSQFFIEILMKLYIRCQEFKRQKNAYEFMDVAKMAIKLVSMPDINKEIKDNLFEILVDEYQDTSDIQETFINLISHNNVYTVGDIKQGIYRFRNANPYIFKTKYENYKNPSNGQKIDLIKNFRSRREVLDDINNIFCDIMSDEFGDASYKEDHQMVFGLTSYEAEGKKEENSNLEILSYSLENTEEEKMVSEGEDGEEIVAKDDETEAFIITRDIKKRIESKEGVLDKETGKLRPCVYSDFAILIDRTSKFDLFKKILESENIPVAINADIPLNNDMITQIIANLLKLVMLTKRENYNEEYYHSFASIARSYLFMMPDNDIFEIIKSSEESQKIDSTTKTIYKKPPENIISNIAVEISKSVDEYSPSDIYSMILDKFNVIERLPLIGNVNERMTIIEFLRNFIENVSKMSESIDDISTYLQDIIKSSDDVKYSVDTKNDPGVKIMTIHKSKGLEFPFCYFPMLHKRFNDADSKSAIGFFEETGFYVRRDDEVNPIAETALREIKEKDISEKIRLFYVALTRAREKMIILLKEKSDEEIDKLKGMGYIKSFNDMLYQIPEKIEEYETHIDLNTLGINKNYLINKTKHFDYTNEKPVYDATDYNGQIISKSRISKEVVEVLSDEEQENLDLGTKMHEIMEYLDFNHPDYDSISDKRIEKKIRNIMESCPLMIDAKNGIKHPEYEFSFEKDGKTYNGIIDLLLEFNDKYVIIDYKLFNIDHDEYDRQLSIYRDYVKSVDDKKPVYCYLLSLGSGNYREVK